MYSTRIVNIDYYLAAPIRGLDVCYSEQRACDVSKVPVLRVYGATPAGRPICIYIYINIVTREPLNLFMKQFNVNDYSDNVLTCCSMFSRKQIIFFYCLFLTRVCSKTVP